MADCDEDATASGDWVAYFAFGSMCNAVSLKRRSIFPAESHPAALLDYELAFHLNGGMANIVPAPGALVHGVVHTITRAEFDALAKIEAIYSFTAVSCTPYARCRPEQEQQGQQQGQQQGLAGAPPHPELRHLQLLPPLAARAFIIPLDQVLQQSPPGSEPGIPSQRYLTIITQVGAQPGPAATALPCSLRGHRRGVHPTPPLSQGQQRYGVCPAWLAKLQRQPFKPSRRPHEYMQVRRRRVLLLLLFVWALPGPLGALAGPIAGSRCLGAGACTCAASALATLGRRPGALQIAAGEDPAALPTISLAQLAQHKARTCWPITAAVGRKVIEVGGSAAARPERCLGLWASRPALRAPASFHLAGAARRSLLCAAVLQCSCSRAATARTPPPPLLQIAPGPATPQSFLDILRIYYQGQEVRELSGMHTGRCVATAPLGKLWLLPGYLTATPRTGFLAAAGAISPGGCRCWSATSGSQLRVACDTPVALPGRLGTLDAAAQRA